MAGRDKHLQKARRNIEFLCEILGVAQSKRKLDWCAIAAFYAAVHIVDACLDPEHHPTSHGDRNKLIGREDFWIEYSSMYSLSKKSRYLDDDAVLLYPSVESVAEAIHDLREITRKTRLATELSGDLSQVPVP
ncbi:MAG TPA: hypothetical protein ENL12_03700 [Dehalococcoidia bacterium]|nr:hypothetical protein [Dehalococcoidia bacterium]